MKKSQNNKAKSLILQYTIGEICIIIVGSIVFWFLKFGEFMESVKFSLFISSIASMGHLGIEAFDALVESDWRHKIANYQYYPIYQAFILIILNAIICALVKHDERWYGYFLFPFTAWLFQIIISTWNKWTR